MNDYRPTRYQEKIIRRYYEHKQEGAFQKLEELVADLYLAETDKQKAALWKKVEKSLVNLKAPPKIIEHLLASKSPEALAKNLKDWWRSLPPEKPEKPADEV